MVSKDNSSPRRLKLPIADTAELRIAARSADLAQHRAPRACGQDEACGGS